jgi:hypothetical protein
MQEVNGPWVISHWIDLMTYWLNDLITCPNAHNSRCHAKALGSPGAFLKPHLPSQVEAFL